MLDLTGTSSIVTGGASGIGEAAARMLAGRGASVVIADLNDEKGEAVAKAIGGGYVKTDVTNPEQVIAAIEAAEEMGVFRSLVCAAGVGWATRTVGRDGTYASAHDLDLYTKVIAINLIGTFNCVRLAATAMSRTEAFDADGQKGAIVTMASVAAFDGQIGQAAYSSSKGGVVGMTLPVARDLAAVGVRLNCIAPGAHRHPDLRHWPRLGGVQGQAQARRRLPEAPRRAGGAGLDGARAHQQHLHERRGRAGRRGCAASAEVGL